MGSTLALVLRRQRSTTNATNPAIQDGQSLGAAVDGVLGVCNVGGREAFFFYFHDLAKKSFFTEYFT